MGYLFEFDALNRLLRITWEGTITDEALREGVELGRRFLESHLGTGVISDFSRVTTFDVSSPTVREVAAVEPRGEQESVVVTVAPHDLTFGMARMFSQLTEDKRPSQYVVRTLEEAYELMHIKDPQFRRIEAL